MTYLLTTSLNVFTNYIPYYVKIPFLKQADIKKQYDIPAVTYRVSMTISTVGSEYWNTAPVGHSKVMKNTRINKGIIHTTKLFRYHALACNQLSKPMSIMASCGKKNENPLLKYDLNRPRYFSAKSLPLLFPLRSKSKKVDSHFDQNGNISFSADYLFDHSTFFI